jgi:hypothetical protein
MCYGMLGTMLLVWLYIICITSLFLFFCYLCIVTIVGISYCHYFGFFLLSFPWRFWMFLKFFYLTWFFTWCCLCPCRFFAYVVVFFSFVGPLFVSGAALSCWHWHYFCLWVQLLGCITIDVSMYRGAIVTRKQWQGKGSAPEPRYIGTSRVIQPSNSTHRQKQCQCQQDNAAPLTKRGPTKKERKKKHNNIREKSTWTKTTRGKNHVK